MQPLIIIRLPGVDPEFCEGGGGGGGGGTITWPTWQGIATAKE